MAELIGRQAEWSEESANYEAAVEMYIKVGPPLLAERTISTGAAASHSVVV